MKSNHALILLALLASQTARAATISVNHTGDNGPGSLRHALAGAAGGGIYNDHSTLTVSNCALSGNAASTDAAHSTGFGGAIYNNRSGPGYPAAPGSGGTATLELINWPSAPAAFVLEQTVALSSGVWAVVANVPVAVGIDKQAVSLSRRRQPPLPA